MAATKNMEHWNERFNLLKDYVKEFNKLPIATAEYRGIKIGGWLHNQKNAHKKGKLPEECVQALNDSFPFWCSSKEEINNGNKNLLLNSEWKSKVIEGHVPIDTVFSGDKLHDYLRRGILDIETLLETEYINIHLYYDCLAKVIPIIHPRYALLLRYVGVRQTVADELDEIKEYFYSFCISSAEEMQDKMNKMMDSFTDREKEVLRLRFALTEDVEYNMTHDAIGTILGITRHRVRQIEVQAIRKLRHPAKMDIIRKTGNDFLDNNDLFDQKTRATLYRLGIDSKDKVERLIEDEKDSSSELIDKLKDAIKKCEEIEAEDVEKHMLKEMLKKPIDELELSVRVYMSLTRAGIHDTKDLVRLYNDEERLMKVRNFGKCSINEVRKKLDKLGVLDLEIEEDE